VEGLRKALDSTPKETGKPNALKKVRTGPEGPPPGPGEVIALQRAVGNRSTGAMISRSRTPASSRVIQRRPLSGYEREQFAAAKARLGELEAVHAKDKALVMDAMGAKPGDPLEYLHRTKLGGIGELIERDNEFFREAKQLARQASSSKSLDAFLRKLNGYDKSGGKNAINNAMKNIVPNLDRELLSQERKDLPQTTALDEVYFKQYLAASKSPMTVYRGDGRGINANSLPDDYAFEDIPYGGTPDVSFYGVVEHTLSSTTKNGMVSTTSSPAVARAWAIDQHNFGFVWEIRLDDYIHVTNLLNARNFRERFPTQFEILAPGSVPAANVVAVSLLRKDGTTVKRVTNQ
jgi:hypothetical protein